MNQFRKADNKQEMRQNGCSGCTNPQIFGTLPFAHADFEAFSTKCNRADFEAQSSLLQNRLHLQIRIPNACPDNCKELTYALSFYRSQNVLCQSKCFAPFQKFDCIQCLFKNICASTKTCFTECKSSFFLAQHIVTGAICK